MNEKPREEIQRELRRLLLKLARRQDELAADERAATPYWTPCPPSVLGHFSAAEALRAEADSLQVGLLA